MVEEFDFPRFDEIASSIAKINTFQLDEEDRTIIDESKMNMGKLCQLEAIMEHHRKCLEMSRNAETEQDFIQAYGTEKSKIKKFDINQSERYKGFVESLRSAPITSSSNANTENLDNSIDLDASNRFEEIIPEFDPITKQPLQHPVRNIICKHVYEKRSIEQSLQINKRLRCPVAGCSNTRHITINMLKDDHALMQTLARMRNEI